MSNEFKKNLGVHYLTLSYPLSCYLRYLRLSSSLDPEGKTPSFDEHSSFIHPEDRAVGLKMVEKAIHEGEPYEVELRGIKPDGEIRILKVNGFPERGPTGQVERLFGSAQDITKQRQSEEVLQESEKRDKVIFDHSPLGMIYFDQFKCYPVKELLP